MPSAVHRAALSQRAGLGEAVAALLTGHRSPAVPLSYTQFILLLRVWDAILGCCSTQCTTKHSRTPSWSGHWRSPGRALGQGLPGLLPVGEAADMAVDVEVDAEAEEEKHPGVCPELNLGGVGGAASSHICWVAPKL